MKFRGRSFKLIANWKLFFLPCLILCLSASEVSANEILVKSWPYNVSKTDGWCSADAQLNIDVTNISSPDIRDLQKTRLAEEIAIVMEFECPEATNIIATIRRNGLDFYDVAMNAANNWQFDYYTPELSQFTRYSAVDVNRQRFRPLLPNGAEVSTLRRTRFGSMRCHAGNIYERKPDDYAFIAPAFSKWLDVLSYDHFLREAYIGISSKENSTTELADWLGEMIKHRAKLLDDLAESQISLLSFAPRGRVGVDALKQTKMLNEKLMKCAEFWNGTRFIGSPVAKEASFYLQAANSRYLDKINTAIGEEAFERVNEDSTYHYERKLLSFDESAKSDQFLRQIKEVVGSRYMELDLVGRTSTQVSALKQAESVAQLEQKYSKFFMGLVAKPTGLIKEPFLSGSEQQAFEALKQAHHYAIGDATELAPETCTTTRTTYYYRYQALPSSEKTTCTPDLFEGQQKLQKQNIHNPPDRQALERTCKKDLKADFCECFAQQDAGAMTNAELSGFMESPKAFAALMAKGNYFDTMSATIDRWKVIGAFYMGNTDSVLHVAKEANLRTPTFAGVSAYSCVYRDQISTMSFEEKLEFLLGGR